MVRLQHELRTAGLEGKLKSAVSVDWKTASELSSESRGEEKKNIAHIRFDFASNQKYTERTRGRQQMKVPPCVLVVQGLLTKLLGDNS